MQNRNFHISIVGIVFVMLIPLFKIPGPAVVTGHPWKVELALSLTVAAAFAWNFVKSSPRHEVSVLASKKRLFAIAAALLFTIWSAISVIWANALFSVAHHTGTWFLYTAVLFLALVYFQNNRSVLPVTAIFGALSAVILAICVFDYLSIAEYGFGEGTLRIRYAKYAELLAMTGPFLFSAAFYARGHFARAVPLAAGCAAWLVVMLSLSKGAFIAGIAGFALMFAGCIVFAGRRIRKPALVAAGIWIVLTAGVQILFVSFSSVPATTQYLSGQAENRETSSFRVFTWKIGTSMALENPIIGVGADNFGIEFNKARRQYNSEHKHEPAEGSIAESYMVERAHNEPIQVFAELGLIGMFLLGLIAFAFVSPFTGLLFKRKRLSPILIGAAGGMTAFALSSLVSSFSFRAIQNGAVFMLLFAVGIYEIAKRDRPNSKTEKQISARAFMKARWLLPSAALVFAAFSGLVGVSNFYTMFGQNEKETALSRGYFDTALALNPENGGAYFMSGIREYIEENPARSLPMLTQARRYGANATVNYYYAASSSILNDDPNSAAELMSEAVATYPHSVYARVHYSVLLAQIGRDEESKRQYDTAFQLNNRQAETWKLILEDSLLNATDNVRRRNDIDLPHKLEPENIIRSIHYISKLKKSRR